LARYVGTRAKRWVVASVAALQLMALYDFIVQEMEIFMPQVHIIVVVVVVVVVVEVEVEVVAPPSLNHRLLRQSLTTTITNMRIVMILPTGVTNNSQRFPPLPPPGGDWIELQVGAVE